MASEHKVDKEPVSAVPGVKFDEGKSRPGLIPARELLQIGDVLAFGAQKYAVDNWKNVPDARARYLDATWRHLLAHMNGEWLDESCHPHLAHAACSLLFLMHFENEAHKK